MKTVFLLFFLVIGYASFGQIHRSFPVKELDSIAAQDTSLFKHHPEWMDIKVSLVDEDSVAFSAYRIDATLTYKEDFSHQTFYKAKNTQTESMQIVPKLVMDLESTIDKPSGKLILHKLNPVLAYWGLTYDANSPLADSTKVLP